MKTVELFPGDPPKALPDFIAWAKALQEQVPPEASKPATIEFKSNEDTDCVYLTVEYERPETDAEMTARIEQEQRVAAETEARERFTLASLKRKYEGAAIIALCLLASACTCAPQPDDACRMAAGAGSALLEGFSAIPWWGF